MSGIRVAAVDRCVYAAATTPGHARPRRGYAFERMHGLRRILCAAAFFGGLIASAGAEAQVPALACELEATPFAATPQNQINGATLLRRLAGHGIVFTRRQAAQFGYNEIQYRFDFHEDGSFTASCAAHNPRRLNAQQVPCRRFNPASRISGRDVGVWRVDGGRLVLRRTGLNAGDITEGFFTLHQQAGVVAVKHMGGLHFCMQGPVKVE